MDEISVAEEFNLETKGELCGFVVFIVARPIKILKFLEVYIKLMPNSIPVK